MPQPFVISLILNTNRREDTLACLASLRRSGYARHHAIVLDNASSDGSVPAIREAHPEVEILSLAENRGYAGNNNVGIRRALERQADWIVVLNEDTVVDAHCLERLVQAGESDGRIGIVGPMVYHFDQPEVVQSAGGMLTRTWDAVHRGANERNGGRFAHPQDVDWISGCCIMIRRQVFEEIGLIDERFFYYWEETELCIRARRAGWRIVHVPQARIWHKGVQPDYRPKPAVTYYAARNRLLALSKHGAPLPVRLAVWGGFLRTLASWTLRPKWRDRREHRIALWKGVRDYLRQHWGPMPD